MMAINKIVLIILFLIVLVAGILILTGYVMPTGENIGLQNELRGCCQKYRAYACPDNPNIIAGIQCAEHNLWELYENFRFSRIDDLKEFCTCPPSVL